MRFREFIMKSSQFTIGKRRFCRGDLRSPAIDFVILNIVKNLFSVIPSKARNLEALVEVGGDCE